MKYIAFKGIRQHVLKDNLKKKISLNVL